MKAVNPENHSDDDPTPCSRPTSSRWRVTPMLALGFALLSTSGCTQAMNSTPQQHFVNGNRLPLHFKLHSFSAHAFNTLACKVIYNNVDFTSEFADNPSGPPPPGDYHAAWGFGTYIGIRNFPGPVDVSWTSLDGSKHEASVDLSQIFENEEVLYRVPEDEIPDDMYPQGLYLDPGIFLEVNDRALTVYMRALIPTKHRQDPNNPYSEARDDLIRAWTHTY